MGRRLVESYSYALFDELCRKYEQEEAMGMAEIWEEVYNEFFDENLADDVVDHIELFRSDMYVDDDVDELDWFGECNKPASKQPVVEAADDTDKELTKALRIRDIKDKVAEELFRMLREEWEDNIAYEISSRIPEYNPEWCYDNGMSEKGRRDAKAVEDKARFYARGLADVLMCYAADDNREGVWN